MESNYGIIDNEHIFNLTKCGCCVESLKVGSRIEYLGYMPQGEDGNIKVSKVLTVSKNTWDDYDITSNEVIFI